MRRPRSGKWGRRWCRGRGRWAVEALFRNTVGIAFDVDDGGTPAEHRDRAFFPAQSAVSSAPRYSAAGVPPESSRLPLRRCVADGSVVTAQRQARQTERGVAFHMFVAGLVADCRTVRRGRSRECPAARETDDSDEVFYIGNVF